MSYNNTLPSSSDAFWSVALECALRRSSHACRHEFDDAICSRYRAYIRTYAPNTSEPAIKMLMLQADTVADDDQKRNRNRHVGFAFLCAVFIGLAVYGWFQRQELRKDSADINPLTQTETNEVMVTLNRVSKALDNGADVNHDGLINCIDAAILFYQFYPERDRVSIASNRNKKKDFFHAFNYIRAKQDGLWYPIEPQAVWSNLPSFWMDKVWGNKYDQTIDLNTTDEYVKFVK